MATVAHVCTVGLSKDVHNASASAPESSVGIVAVDGHELFEPLEVCCRRPHVPLHVPAHPVERSTGRRSERARVRVYMNIRGEKGESIRLERVTPPLSGGDHLVRVTVNLGDYTGAVEAWVHSDAWSGFCRQLVAVEQSRRGSAVLESMSPGALRLEILATDSLGHMGIRGRLHQAGLAPAPALEFGIVSFDPNELVALVRDLRSDKP